MAPTWAGAGLFLCILSLFWVSAEPIINHDWISANHNDTKKKLSVPRLKNVWKLCFPGITERALLYTNLDSAQTWIEVFFTSFHNFLNGQIKFFSKLIEQSKLHITSVTWIVNVASSKNCIIFGEVAFEKLTKSLRHWRRTQFLKSKSFYNLFVWVICLLRPKILQTQKHLCARLQNLSYLWIPPLTE